MSDVVKSWSARLNPATDKPVAAPTREEAEAAVRTLILWAGDDPSREGLIDTPKRVAKAYEQLFKGYRETPASGPHRASAAVSTIVIASYSTMDTSTDSATIVHTPP